MGTVTQFCNEIIDLVPRFGVKLKRAWLRHTYPFSAFGEGVTVAWSCKISRAESGAIALGDGVYLAPKVSIDVPRLPSSPRAKIVIGKGSEIGRRSIIRARNRVVIEDDVLVAPDVLVSDYTDGPDLATATGSVTVGKNSWVGYRAAIICHEGEVIVGRNSVVAANAVVTQSFPPFSVIAGNPAKLIKTYDPERKIWRKVSQ